MKRGRPPPFDDVRELKSPQHHQARCKKAAPTLSSVGLPCTVPYLRASLARSFSILSLHAARASANPLSDASPVLK